MRNIFSFLAALAIAGALSSGCSSAEKKLGRGMSNMTEFARLGEMRRSIEQTALFDQPGGNYATGVIRGLTRSFVRTGVGVYEVVTFPIPPYDPACADYLRPEPWLADHPVYPDNYRPDIIDDAMFATDMNMGFSGGDLFPYIPGSKFKVFDTH